MEQNEIVHIHFANGAQLGADETLLISSKVECMGLDRPYFIAPTLQILLANWLKQNWKDDIKL